MKTGLLFIGSIFIAAVATGQRLSVNDLLEASNLTSQKSSNFFSKKGYTPAGTSWQNDTAINTWQESVKLKSDDENPVVRRVSRYQYGTAISYCWQTPYKDEYLSAISSLKRNGFFCGNEEDNPDSAYLFQRKNITVQTSLVHEDSVQYYSLNIYQQPPPARPVRFAEDLLQFTSHEYLVTYFGSENVKRDVYFFSDKELNKCSVLFPNSRRQVVFIWKDQKNLRDLSHILIGGNMNTTSSKNFHSPLPENDWTLQNGLRFNMRLSDLLELNGEDFQFYGKGSDNFLTVIPKSKGQIDFNTTGVVLDCLNCNVSTLLNRETVSATDAINDQLSLHVGMILLIPGK